MCSALQVPLLTVSPQLQPTERLQSWLQWRGTDMEGSCLVLEDVDALLLPSGGNGDGLEGGPALPVSQQLAPLWQLCSQLLVEAPGLNIVATSAAWSAWMAPPAGPGGGPPSSAGPHPTSSGPLSFDVRPQEVEVLDPGSSLALLQLHAGFGIGPSEARVVLQVDGCD